MKILITGAAGFIGSALLKKIYPEVFENIMAIDNFSVGKISDVNGLKVQKMDICDKEDVKKMLEGVDTIVHLAAISGVPVCDEKPIDANMANLTGVKYVLDEAVKQGIKKVIFPSSAAVYGQPEKFPIEEEDKIESLNYYAVLKIATEHLVRSYQRNYGLKTVIIRKSNIYGKGVFAKNTVINIFVKKVLAKEPIEILGTGEQSRNFLHINDAIQAYTLLIRDPNVQGTFNVGGHETKSIKQIAEMVNKIAKKELGYEVPIEFKETDRKEASVSDFTYSSERIKKAVGYRPIFTIEDEIRRLIKELK